MSFFELTYVKNGFKVAFQNWSLLKIVNENISGYKTKHIFFLYKFLSLTEEDLNKFESLTMGAKKKLKTQLELEK